MTVAPSSAARSAAPDNCVASVGASEVRTARASGVEVVSMLGSTVHSIFRSRPTTSINAWRKISSDSLRINESRAPALTMPNPQLAISLLTIS